MFLRSDVSNVGLDGKTHSISLRSEARNGHWSGQQRVKRVTSVLRTVIRNLGASAARQAVKLTARHSFPPDQIARDELGIASTRP